MAKSYKYMTSYVQGLTLLDVIHKNFWKKLSS